MFKTFAKTTSKITGVAHRSPTRTPAHSGLARSYSWKNNLGSYDVICGLCCRLTPATRWFPFRVLRHQLTRGFSFSSVNSKRLITSRDDARMRNLRIMKVGTCKRNKKTTRSQNGRYMHPHYKNSPQGPWRDHLTWSWLEISMDLRSTMYLGSKYPALISAVYPVNK
jgi:hypothetical protein